MRRLSSITMPAVAVAALFAVGTTVPRVEELLSEIIRIDTSNPPGNDYDEARARLERSLRSEPMNVEAVVGLAFVEAQLQDYTMAAKLYRQPLDIQPSATIEQALAIVDANDSR